MMHKVLTESRSGGNFRNVRLRFCALPPALHPIGGLFDSAPAAARLRATPTRRPLPARMGDRRATGAAGFPRTDKPLPRSELSPDGGVLSYAEIGRGNAPPTEALPIGKRPYRGQRLASIAKKPRL